MLQSSYKQTILTLIETFLTIETYPGNLGMNAANQYSYGKKEFETMFLKYEIFLGL